MRRLALMAGIAVLGIGGGFYLAKALRAVTAESPSVPVTIAEPFRSAALSIQGVRPQRGIDGQMHAINDTTPVSSRDGMAIYDLIRKQRPKQTVEVGLAYGGSTMYILAGLAANGSGAHIAIDPFQDSEWHGIGLQKVHEVGMESHFRLMSEMSFVALPALRREGVKIDFAFIDGAHWFESALLDFMLTDLACSKDCLIVLDDAVGWPPIEKAVKYIERNRVDYRRISCSSKGLAAFQKIGPDRRPEAHFMDF